MATLPFIADTHLSVPMASPDWGFLSGQVQKANQQYEQGLQEISSDYSAVLNADVTNQQNQEKKAEYIKQFQQGLGKLAGSNVALPKYQAEAEKIIAPFWQDNALLTDMSYTKFKKSEIAKGQSAQYSKEEDVRNTYAPESVELMQLQLDNLRYMDRNHVTSNNLSWDTYTPFTNLTNVLGQHKKDDGFEVTHDIRMGDGTIQRVTNGPGSISNYKVYGQGIIGPQHNKQFQVMGKLAVERQIATYRQMGLPREQAIADLGKEEYGRTLESHKSNIEAFDNTISQKKQLLQAIMANVNSHGGRPDPRQENMINQLNLEIANYSQMKGQLVQSTQELTTENGKNGFLIQPENAIAQRMRSDLINHWAYGMSQDVSTQLVKDDAWWEGKKETREWAQLSEQRRHNMRGEGQEDQRIGIAQGELQLKGAEFKQKYPELFNNSQVAPGAFYSGNALTQIAEEDKPMAANAARTAAYDKVYGSVYSPAGLSGMMLYQKPTSNTDINSTNEFNNAVNGFTETMNKLYTGGAEATTDNQGVLRIKGVPPTAIQQFQKVANWLHDQTGINTSTVEGAHKALLTYTAKNLETLSTAGAQGAAQANSIRQVYMPIKETLDKIDKDTNQRDANLKAYIAANPNASPYIVNDKRGARLLNEEDIKREIGQDVRLADGSTLPAAVVAKAYTSGNLGVHSTANGNVMIINDKQYPLPYKYDQFAPATPIERVLQKYGDSKNYKQAVTTIQNTVLPGTEFYNQANNSYAGRYTYNIDPDKGKVNRDRLQELVMPGNYEAMYVRTPGQTGEPEVAPATASYVRNMLNNPEYKQYIGTTFDYNLQGFNGKPMAEIHIADELPANAPDEYKKLKGKTILVEKAATAAGTYVNQFPKEADYSFHDLNRGKAVTSDAIEAQINKCEWSVTPWPSTGVPQYYIANMTKTLINNKTGKEERVTSQPIQIPATANPDRVISEIRGVSAMNGANYYKAQDQMRANLNKQ